MTYAENTSVSVEKSKFELGGLLQKHGATQRVFADDDAKGVAVVCFSFGAAVEERRQYRLEIPLPKIADFATRAVHRYGRTLRVACTQEQQRIAHEQACRVRWRAIVLLVKAKLELIALGMSSVEHEFLADLVLADGNTVHRSIADKIAAALPHGRSEAAARNGGTVNAPRGAPTSELLACLDLFGRGGSSKCAISAAFDVSRAATHVHLPPSLMPLWIDSYVAATKFAQAMRAAVEHATQTTLADAVEDAPPPANNDEPEPDPEHRD